MNRLKDEGGDDPVAVRGIELLRSTSPTPGVADMRRRVWFSLQRPRPRAPSVFLSLVPRLRLAVLVVGLGVVATSSAGAVIAARRWIVPVFRGDAQPAPAISSPERKARPARVPAARTSEPPAAASPPAPARKVAIVHRPSHGSEAPVGVPAAAAIARERTQVLDAMIALRRDHDPVTATTLLDRYLNAHPAGALREEALVLSIEAANASGDRAAAARRARDYQDAYPNGRFRLFAQSQSASSP